MWILRWLTRNWADTDDPASDLEPLLLQQDMPQAMLSVQKAAQFLTRWRVEAVDEAAGTIHATRRTKLWGFVDDIYLRLEPFGGGTRVHGRSQSRVGLGDLGQNRRNLLELGEVLQLLNTLNQLQATSAELRQATEELSRANESRDSGKDQA